MCEKLQPAKLDPILGLSQLFQADPRSEKVDLGIGVYKAVSTKEVELWGLARCCAGRGPRTSLASTVHA